MIAIIGAAWLAILAWAGANGLRAAGWSWAARIVWTAGALALAAHAALALHIVHGWDHDDAYRTVALETYETIGLDWGGGIYINHAFVALWLADAASWWLARRGYETRPRMLDAAVQSVFLFMFVNATLVFGSGWTRPAGAVLCVAGALAWRRCAMSRMQAGQPPA